MLKERPGLLLSHLLDVEVSGRQNLEVIEDGTPAILCFFPHCGHPDSVVVRRAIDQDLIFLAAGDYWDNSALKGRLRSKVSELFVKSIPIGRASSGRQAILEGIERAEACLKAGESVVLAPEGTRNNRPLTERELLIGAAELLLRTGAPIIPIRLRGLDDVMPKGSKLPKPVSFVSYPPFVCRKKVLVSFGKPMFFEDIRGIDPAEMANSRKRRVITERLRGKLLGML